MFCCYAENDHNYISNSAVDLSTNTAYSLKPLTDTEREEGSFQILDPVAMEVSSNLAYGTNSFMVHTEREEGSFQILDPLAMYALPNLAYNTNSYEERDNMVLSSRNDSQLEQDTIYDYID